MPSARQKVVQDGGCCQDTEVSLCHSFLLAHFLWSDVGPSWAAILQEHLLCHGEPPPPLALVLPLLCPSDSLLLSLFDPSLRLPPSSLSGMLPFLKYVFPEAPLAWLMGSVVSCGGSVGAAHVQHGAAPGLFSQKPPCRPSYTKTLTLTPNTQATDAFQTSR